MDSGHERVDASQPMIEAHAKPDAYEALPLPKDTNGDKPRPLPVPVPTPIKPGRVGTYEIAKAYLDSLHCTLWPAEAWYVRDEAGQDAAAVWITQMVDTVNAIRNMVNGSDGMSVAQAAEDYRRMVER